MKSRMERYYQDDLSDYERTKKNANLYHEVYGNYDESEEFPIENNTQEIDISKLNTIISSRGDYKNIKTIQSFTNASITERKKEEKIEEQVKKIYDINELLEKAKVENSRLKKVQDELIQTNYNFLSALEKNDVNEDSIMKTKAELEVMDHNSVLEEKDKIEEQVDENYAESNSEEKKYETKKLSNDPEITQIYETEAFMKSKVNTNSLPLDILNDLKPDDDTTVSSPISEEQKEKEDVKNATFYSGSYTFSKKDFLNGKNDIEDEDFLISKNNHTFLKILLLIVGIAILGASIIYILQTLGVIETIIKL